MLNVFLIVHNFSGARTYINELSEFLVKKNDVFVFHVYLNYRDSKEFWIQKNNKITSIYIPCTITKEYNKKYYKHAAQLVFCHFQNLRNVIFHANIPEQFYFAEESLRLYRCPLVFTLHFLENFYSYFDLGAVDIKNIKVTGVELYKAIIKIADHIICVTSFSFRVISKHYKVEPLKASVIYNGIKIPNKSVVDRSLLKCKYGFLSSDKLILYAGRLQASKGIDKLIQAFLLIKDRFPTAKLIIVGSGECNKYLPLPMGCTGRIHFTGNLDKNTLIDFYKICDMGIIPSRFEQCSYVAIEMMHYGLPLIISDVPGLNELVIHKKTGLICKTVIQSTTHCQLEVDVADLANHIEQLLMNNSEAIEYAKNASEQVLDKHSVENMGKNTLRIYRQLING